MASGSDTETNVLTIGQLNNAIRNALQNEFRSVWVAGEIVDLSRPHSGHLYFSLKDASGSVKGVMWRSDAARLQFDLEDGQQVVCCGNVDVYPPRGTYQLVVRRVQLQGEGELQAKLRKLRARLQAEGLFAAERKRPLPRFPKHIAVVTSPSGAAVRDFLEVIRRRWTDVRVTIVPTRVQGQDVGPEIARAIRSSGQLKPDAVVVTRGGGSLEDLWGFNDEEVVRAIYDSVSPVVSAVGHEIDVTLADLVADRRALTPTEAGELLVPNEQEWSQHLNTVNDRLRRLLRLRYDHAQERLNSLAKSRVLRDPRAPLREYERMLDEIQMRAKRAIWHCWNQGGVAVAQQAGRLESLSPLQVLARGYSLTQLPNGALIKQISDVGEGDEVRIRVSDGSVTARVLSTESE